MAVEVSRSVTRVTVIIPCRNEEDHVERCLRDLFAQEPVPGGFEVVVADGCSENGPRAVLARLQGACPALRVIDNPGRIVSTGRRAAIRQARTHHHAHGWSSRVCKELRVPVRGCAGANPC
jgi:cellulose synthase/poly-beta-1,6-N-acetylglucosamine synthase-like glycosyltransferase